MSETKTIRLENGGSAIVDAEDYDAIIAYRWFRSSQGYAYRQGWDGPQNHGGRHWTVWMHREINATPPDAFTDHVNGQKLDNRRCNLRTVNKAQNSANRPKSKRVTVSSVLKGVSLHKASGLWRARLQDGKYERTTYHKTEQQAALDYNRMGVERFGEYAQLNTLPDGIAPTPKRERKSKYRGVRPYAWGRFGASLEKGGKSIDLGTFDLETEAAQAYNDGAKLHFGERAKLNMIV